MGWIINFTFLVLSFGVISDIPTTLFLLFVYLLGMSITYLMNKKERKYLIKIYHALFTGGGIYMLLSYFYMTHNNYEFLLAYDIHEYFLPRTQLYLSGGTLVGSLEVIWADYDFFNRFQSGYFTYAVFFGYLAQWFDANFYLSQQISVLFLFSFVGIVIYKMFKVNGFSTKKAYRYTLIISFFSILFFYSSQVLRDTHILLLYLLATYLTFKKDFSIVNLLKLIAVIYICTTFRLESGLFLVILIPVYLLLTMQRSRNKSIALFFSVTLSIGAIILSSNFLVQIENTVEANQASYVDHITETGGMIAMFQRIPIAGDFASIIYNAVQPLPFWSRLSTNSNSIEDQAVYNIMNFPRSFASFFNWFVIITIIVSLSFKKVRLRVGKYISKPLKYQLWIGMLFLFLQSAVISQRRLLAYYVIYYILFFIIYNQLKEEEKKYINVFAIISFVALQLVGLIYLI